MYSRILLKLSGEALMGKEGFGIDPAVMAEVSRQIKEVQERHVQIAAVIGGGNIYRGLRAEQQGVDRVVGDYMGMIATVMNGLALHESLRSMGVAASFQSALPIAEVVAPFNRRMAIDHLEKGRVVIFAGGTGNPFFTTDTAAALRALEVRAQAIFKATRVDGVYDKDPEKHSDATLFKEISYIEVLDRGLKVMDATAITLCMENKLPIVVFNLKNSDNMRRAASGEEVGTLVRG
jgi:uridylate kinase